jgi:hypothetical protein
VLTLNAILKWCAEAKVEWHYIAPSKPMQNTFMESFSGRTRPCQTWKLRGLEKFVRHMTLVEESHDFAQMPCRLDDEPGAVAVANKNTSARRNT